MRFPIAAGLMMAVAPLLNAGPPQLETRLVDLNVVAVDKEGTPVDNLTIDDFLVSDGGKPQKVVFFHHVDGRPSSPPYLGPHEFSNRVATRTSHATVILFDLLNERMGTRTNAWSQLVRYLGSLKESDDLYLYLLTLDGRLFAVRGLTGAPAQSGETTEPWTRQIKPLLDQAMTTVTRLRPVDIDVAVRVQLTYAALLDLTGQVSRVPGRKNIVWITDGVPIELGPRRSDTGDFVDFTPQLRQLSETLHRFGVTIYPARQIMLGSTDGPPDLPGVQSGSSNAAPGMASDETLDEFARMTGGRPDGGKDIAGAIKQAMIDGRSSYQLGYYPEAKSWDGKFHKIRVVCTRKGVRIRTREGYYAWRESPEERARGAIDDVVSMHSDPAEIGLLATLSADPQDPGRVHFRAVIDANDLAFARDADRYAAHLRLAIVGYWADGQTVGSPVIPMDLYYTAHDLDAALPSGIEFTRDLSIAEGVKSVRLFVFDLGSNEVGSVTVPVGAAHNKE
jgi:VWFA-related protein